MNIYKGDCEICGGWVGIQNNFNLDNEHDVLCGECWQKEYNNENKQ